MKKKEILHHYITTKKCKPASNYIYIFKSITYQIHHCAINYVFNHDNQSLQLIFKHIMLQNWLIIELVISYQIKIKTNTNN